MAVVHKQLSIQSNGQLKQPKQQQQLNNVNNTDADMSSHREELIQRRQREAAESKARTLAMYDNMAKSGNAGDKRPLDINTYRGKESGKLLLSGAALQKTDLVEETIRERVRASEENKKRLLAAYDYAAKTQPAGTVRDVDLAAFQGVDGESGSYIFFHFFFIIYNEQTLLIVSIRSIINTFPAFPWNSLELWARKTSRRGHFQGLKWCAERS